MLELFRLLIILELIARIVGPKDVNEPYLISLFGSEPITEFEEKLYAALESEDMY